MEVIDRSSMMSTKRSTKAVQHRQFGRVPTRLWMGQDVPQFSRLKPLTKMLYLYLLSNPYSNMVGIYYLRWGVVPVETGLSQEQVKEAAEELMQEGLIAYDAATSEVFVVDFWMTQVSGGEPLDPQDKRVRGAQALLEQVASAQFAEQFLKMNPEFNDSCASAIPSEAPSVPLRSPSEAPPKPESREQRTEKREQRAERTSSPEAAASERPLIKGKSKSMKTAMPSDFGISPEVRQWAEENKFSDLDEHLETFKTKVRAHGYRYVDWDAALKNAIRDDWAGCRRGRRQSENQFAGVT